MAFVGPKPKGVVLGCACEGDALRQKTLTQAKSTCGWDDQEQPQLGDTGFAGPYAKDRTQALPCGFGDPPALAGRIAIADEVRKYLGNQRFETRVETLFAFVEFGVLLDQPSGITDREIPQVDVVRVDFHRPSNAAFPRSVNLSRLQTAGPRANSADHRQGIADMGIDKESDITANLQIGPTSLGLVRIYVEGDGVEIPMDFDPEEAEEIADEIRAAAARARQMDRNRKPKGPTKK